MKTIYVVLLILLPAVCGIADDTNINAVTNSAATQICEPGTTKMKECNRCRCSRNGLHWMCTRKACPSFMRRTGPNEVDFVCTPNKIFKYTCNTCTCNAEGNGANCTELTCDDINESIKSSNSNRLLSLSTTTVLPVGSDCVPGTRFRKDCNTCFCTSTGLAVCTLRGCIAGPVNIPLINQPKQKRQTNIQGQYPMNTRIYTYADLNDPKFTCIPSHSFKLECNTCWCSADGRTPRFCTKLACNPKTYPTNIVNSNS